MITKNKEAIGIVGGVGPLAGADLLTKIIKNTRAVNDQDHIDTYLVSIPSVIPDRTEFLLSGGEDPSVGLNIAIEKLNKCGATYFGIGCNTAHSKRILENIKIPDGMTFINMIKETVSFVKKNYSDKKVGLLSTLGTLKTGVYNDYFKEENLDNLITLPQDIAEKVNDAIYNKEYGIKTLSKVSEKSFSILKEAIQYLKIKKGCYAVLLACTELPLAFENKDSFDGVDLIDPTTILATSLINAIKQKNRIYKKKFFTNIYIQ